jgi:hypothetical protein
MAVMSLGTGSDRDEALRRAVCITAGVIVTKQLVAAPANVLTPGACAFPHFCFLLDFSLADNHVRYN